MSRLELKDVPDQLVSRLAERAAQHGRSIEDEAVECIAEAVGIENGARCSGKPTLEELERFRSSLVNIFVTEEELQAAKREGRP